MNKGLLLGVFLAIVRVHGRVTTSVLLPTKGISWLLRFTQQFTCAITTTYLTHTIDYMHKMYEKERERVLDSLGSADNYSVTTDFWTSCQSWSYGTFTIHYINNAFDIQSNLLGLCNPILGWILLKKFGLYSMNGICNLTRYLLRLQTMHLIWFL